MRGGQGLNRNTSPARSFRHRQQTRIGFCGPILAESGEDRALILDPRAERAVILFRSAGSRPLRERMTGFETLPTCKECLQVGHLDGGRNEHRTLGFERAVKS
jgi:hypothetical protein